jgi:hypothetical protein
MDARVEIEGAGKGLVYADVSVRGRSRSRIFRNGTAGHDDFCGCRSEERLIGAYMPKARVIMMVKDRLRWRQGGGGRQWRHEYHFVRVLHPLTRQKDHATCVLQ